MKYFKTLIKCFTLLFFICILLIGGVYAYAKISPKIEIKKTGSYYLYDVNDEVFFQGLTEKKKTKFTESKTRISENSKIEYNNIYTRVDSDEKDKTFKNISKKKLSIKDVEEEEKEKVIKEEENNKENEEDSTKYKKKEKKTKKDKSRNKHKKKEKKKDDEDNEDEEEEEKPKRKKKLRKFRFRGEKTKK